MRFIQAAGITMHYALEGREGASTILFANSIGTDFRIWDEVVAQLGQDFQLLRYDMRGHGLSDATPGPYSIGQLADDCVALLDALGIERVYMCGLSIGGMVAQQLSATYSERVAAAIFCDTAMRIGTAAMWNQRAEAVRQQGLASIADAVLKRWFTESFIARGIGGYRNMLCRIPAEGYAACCEAIRDADLTGSAASIRMPALVVVGEEDLATSPAAAQELCQALPDGRFKMIAAAGHIPCVEQPQALADLLREFLQEVSHG